MTYSLAAALAFALVGPAALAAPCGQITGAKVHLPDGAVVERTVSWTDGRISPAAASSCQVHSLPPGAVLTPGLIATSSQIGLVEISLESSTHRDTLGSDEIRADVQVIDGYDPRGSVLGVSRLGGLTSAVVVPSGGWISGTSAFVTLRTAPVDEVTVKAQAGVELHLDGQAGPAGTLARLRALFAEAALLYRAKGEDRLRLPADLSASGPELAALYKVVSGELPLVVHADRASDIEAVLRLTREQKIRAVVVGAAEGWLIADALAEARVGVVIDPLVYGAGSVDQLHGRPDNAALLRAAGVQVAISAGDTHNARALRFLAGNAVRGGMTHADAVAAITRVPAELFGVSDRGVVREGARADLAVWSGDPLEPSSRLLLLVIDGEVQPLRSRQTELVEASREVPRVLHLEP